MRYDFEPGRLGPRRTRWPADTTLAPSAGKVTVLAFLHPRCVCTAATVKQLIRTMRANPGAELTAVVFVPPEPEPAKDWQDGEYVRTIRADVPGARIAPDRGGLEAQRFGASTSGTILVYDRQGKEVFRGGITDRRGGERDNPGLRQLARALSGAERNEFDIPPPVFGCPLNARTTASAAPGNRGDAP
jgi:hypothetical protein